jgi:hypothetical protein
LEISVRSLKVESVRAPLRRGKVRARTKRGMGFRLSRKQSFVSCEDRLSRRMRKRDGASAQAAIRTRGKAGERSGNPLEVERKPRRGFGGGGGDKEVAR